MAGPDRQTRISNRLPIVATALALATCYGTLALITALSLMGIALTVHEGLWAGAIVLFAFLALAGIMLGYQAHRAPGPSALALAGATSIVWVMFGSYDRLVEFAGFALLLGATLWDWNLKRSSPQSQEKKYER